jgi:hypothetical protein
MLVVLASFGAGCGGEERADSEEPASPPGTVLRLQSALAEPTLTVTIDLGGYLGSINIGSSAAAGQGTAYAVELPSGQHDITTPLAFDESGSTKLATLTVDALAGTIALTSPYFQPVAPGDRALHLQTVAFPYEPGDSAIFAVGLLGVGNFSGGGGVYEVRVLDNRRYRLFQGYSWNREGTSGLFSADSDLFVRNGCAEIVPGALAERSFSVQSCRLRPRLTVITVSPNLEVPVALWGVVTLPQGQPFKVIRERLYRFAGPSSLDLVTGAGEFSDRPDLFVGSEGGPDIARFLEGTRAGQLFSTNNRMIVAEKVARLTYDAAGSTTEIEIADGYPIDSTDMVKGRRYVLKALRSWDPEDLVSQRFIAGRFGGEPGVIITDDGRLQVTDAVHRHFNVVAYPPKLTARVGNVRFTAHGISEKIRVNATVIHGGAHCATKVLTDRLHQVALIAPGGSPVASTNFTFGADGHCTPSTLTFPQGTLSLDCSL